MRALAVAALASALMRPAALAAPKTSDAALPKVEVSTGAERPMTVTDLYNGAKYRDPFIAVSGQAPTQPAAEQPADSRAEPAEDEPAEPEFSIHLLNLKGIMRDKKGATAILVHVKTGQGFIFRNGRLYDYKNHRVPDVTGVIQVKQKSMILMTPDKDVQTLVLGEEEGSEAGKKSP